MTFFYSEFGNDSKSYKDLIFDLNSEKKYKYVCKNSSFYGVFKDIIASLLNDTPIILADSDLSDREIAYLGIDALTLGQVINCTYSDVVDVEDLIRRITLVKNWELTMFTSGTTGVPKRITHSFNSITRTTKINPGRSSDIWGFAYNPTHFAGIQVLFQALLNGNHVIRLFNMSKKLILYLIEFHRISHISATPTFYRLIFDSSARFTFVKNITMGGEKFDEYLKSRLQNMFPHAKFLNIYASTEAGTLFTGESELLTIKESQKQFYRVVDNELFIAEELIGKSDQIILSDGWFKTGDLVEVISESPLIVKLLGRINESINIGGYKVFPSEVEETINAIKGVRRSFCYGKKNSVLGNLIACDIELTDKSITEDVILDFLKDKLQSFKIPRIINFVENVIVTRNGKLFRK